MTKDKDRQTKDADHVLDKTETILASLLCADHQDDYMRYGGKRLIDGFSGYEEVDSGILLKFDPEFPRSAYTTQIAKGDRIYATHSDYLAGSVQDALGDRAEFAVVCDDFVRWLCFKKITRAPRGVWVSSPGASLYESHYRVIFPSGVSTYMKRVVGVSKSGSPVICAIQGTHGEGSKNNSKALIVCASIIEDAHRSNAFHASVTEGASIIFPVPIGEHKDIFSLRDAPLTPAGRRKAILHWVSKHTRQSTKTSAPSTVKPHLRGVREISMDGMTVRLTSNT